MGKRSIVKRLGRAYDAFANSLLKKGRAVEQSIAEKSTAFAGTTITDNMACCQGEAKECLCKTSRDTMLKTHVACLPHKVNRFKSEWQTFSARLKSPGEITMEELRMWPYAIVAALFLFWLGQSIGRGSFIDYRYKEY